MKTFFNSNQHSKAVANRHTIIQPKLEVGRPDDAFEQEADAVAKSVIASEQSIQRKCASCDEEDKIQRQEEEEEEELLQPQVQCKSNTSSGQQVSPWIQNQLNKSRGGGHELDNITRSFMENRMKSDFSRVRIHTDSSAIQMNHELNAKAFTMGSDIYFNAGQYQPQNTNGKKLLAHELTHTLQQGASDFKEKIQREEIDHRTLSWDDFKGSPPDSSSYDAMTTSDIRDPMVSAIKPKEADITSSGTSCGEEGGKGFKAKLEYDVSAIEVKAFMDPDASWKNSWTTEAEAQETKCQNEFVSKCKSSFSDGEEQAEKKAEEDVKECEKQAAQHENGLIYECEGEEVVVKKGECKSKMKDCFAQQRKDSLFFEADNKVGNTYTVNSKADCDTKLLEACKKTLVPEISKALLKHEQGHFDIPHEIARQIETELREKAESLTTEAEGCTEEEAKTKAEKALAEKKPIEEFKKIWKEGKKRLEDTQGNYDDETAHSSKHEVQGAWNEKIEAGEL